MEAARTVTATLGSPIKRLASDGLVLSRWRQDQPEVPVTVAGGLVVILFLSSASTVERRCGRQKSEVRQSRLGLISAPDPTRESTVVVRGGGDALFVTFPGSPLGAANKRTLFVEEDPVLAQLTTQALSLLYSHAADPLATGQLLLKFNSALLHSPDVPTSMRGGLAPIQLRRAQEMIDAALDLHVLRSPSLAELSSACGVSLSHFAREFRRSTGETPYAYSLRRRIEAARDLLVFTDESVTSISYRTGFVSPAHFTQLFHKMVGVSPGRFRALVRL